MSTEAKIQTVKCNQCGVVVKTYQGEEPVPGVPSGTKPVVTMDISEQHAKETGHWNFVDA